ncbi:MAG: DUF4168 domain-containing protein [Spirochaetia bacterium]
MKKFITVLCLITMMIFVSAQTVFAQEQGFDGQTEPVPDDVTEEELDVFFDALEEIIEKQQGYQEEADELVQESPLSAERFNEINRILHSFPEEKDTIDRTELRQYENIAESLEKLNREFTDESTVIIQDEGMSLERFQVISNYVNANPELMEERMN